MRLYYVLFALALLAAPFLTTSAEAARSQRTGRSFKAACKTTKPLPKQFIYKTIGSHHFTNDCRRNTIGLIMSHGARGYGGDCIEVFSKKGKLLAKMGNYGQGWSGGPARYYNCIGCSGGQSIDGFDLARAALKDSKSKDIYLRFSGVKNTCYGPITADECVNSRGC